MSLRIMFYALIRKHTYNLLKDWRPEVACNLHDDLHKLIDETMNEISDKINSYITSHPIGLGSIEAHAEHVAEVILIPYILGKHVE